MVFRCKAINGGLNFGTRREEVKQFLLDNEGKELRLEVVKGRRTPSQNNSIHLYLTQLANELRNEGHTIKDVVNAIRRAEIMPTMLLLKEVLWKPIQKVLFKKDSTTKLDKHEVTDVYDAVNAFIAREFEIHVPFPCEDELAKIDPTYIKN